MNAIILSALLGFLPLTNRTVVLEDLTVHQIVEIADCRNSRQVNDDEIMVRTPEAKPYCYIVKREKIGDMRFKPSTKKTWK